MDNRRCKNCKYSESKKRKEEFNIKKPYHVVSFSGGKDSTAMLLHMPELGMPIDEVVTVDTGMEFPAMYRHIATIATGTHQRKNSTSRRKPSTKKDCASRESFKVM